MLILLANCKDKLALLGINLATGSGVDALSKLLATTFNQAVSWGYTFDNDQITINSPLNDSDLLPDLSAYGDVMSQ